MEKQDQAALHPTVSPGIRAVHAANRVMFAIQQDDMDAALDWGNRLSQYPDDILGAWLQHVPPRLLIARGEKTAAAEQLQGLFEKAIQADARGYAIQNTCLPGLSHCNTRRSADLLGRGSKDGATRGLHPHFCG